MTRNIFIQSAHSFQYCCLLSTLVFILQVRQATVWAQTGPDAEIRGKITISKNGEPEHQRTAIQNRYSTHGPEAAGTSMLHPGTAPLRLSERTVVYLESNLLSREKYAPPEKSPTLDQKNLQFHPQVLPILVGTTVDFPNQDNLFHNVFSYSQPKEFDLGRYPKDDSRSVRFDKPGVVRVYCDIHSQMNATILVLPHPYFATPNDSGTYFIRHVPEGKYTLVFWYERDSVERRPIEVHAGESIEVNFSY
jgi:plastocyanin